MKTVLIPILAAALAGPAFAAPPEPHRGGNAAIGEEVRIPLARFRLRSFRADSRDVVFLEDHRRNWYRAEVLGSCIDLPFAHAIGLDTRGSSTLDKFSAIVVRGERCPLVSLTRSEKPQKKVKTRRT